MGGEGLQFCIFFLYFPLFWHDFSLKPCQFSLSYYVFFLQLYSISGNASYDKWMICNSTYFPRVFQLNHDNGRVIRKETQFRFRCFKETAFAFRPQ